jgi:carbon-monoxide dehydrogenase large subunit
VEPSEINGNGNLVGASVRRREDFRLIQGEGRYTGDILPRNAAVMMVLRSPHANARIISIDARAARELPGVLAVITGAEFNATCAAELPVAGVREHMKVRSRWPMAAGLVRYEGEPVAVVVATDAYTARDALELIDVNYEPQSAVVDCERALESDSPLVHEDMGTNLCVTSSRTVGDPDTAFAEADGILSLRLVEPRLVPNAMEPRAVTASYDRGVGEITLWLSTQAPHMERRATAGVLGLPESHIRVLSRDVGGGFGAKIDTYPETIIAAAMAMRLNRPVRWDGERQEEFTSTIHGRGEVQYVDAAYRNDGRLVALRTKYYTDLGAYSFGGTHGVAESLTPSGAAGAYTVEHLQWEVFGVYTNKMTVGPYRGYGQHATAYAAERVMDSIAQALDMDPAEVRRRNLIPTESFPYRTPTGRLHDSGDYLRGLDAALELAGYSELREEQARLKEGGQLLGIGIATTVDASGFGPSGSLSVRPGYETSTVQVDSTGHVTVYTGSSPHGQAHETTFAQIAGDELAVPLEDVTVIYGDTALIPQGTGTRASRSIVVGGSAVVTASRQVKDKALKLAASLLRTEPQFVNLRHGGFFAEDIPDRYVSWRDVAALSFGPQPMPEGTERGLDATVYWEPESYTFPYTANVAVVHVDPDNGTVQLTAFYSVNDFGVLVNPMVVYGQVHGGLAQGIGAAMMEEAVWDETGPLLSGSFMDYAMPLAKHLPDFHVQFMETPSPFNPLGVKGMGETPTIAAVPAIVNAVADALSQRGTVQLDIPLKPERVWQAIKGQLSQ